MSQIGVLVGKVEYRETPSHRECGPVVGPGGLLGGAEGAEPDPGAVLVGVAYLRRELPPRPPPHAAVAHLLFFLPLLHAPLRTDRRGMVCVDIDFRFILFHANLYWSLRLLESEDLTPFLNTFWIGEFLQRA